MFPLGIKLEQKPTEVLIGQMFAGEDVSAATTNYNTGENSECCKDIRKSKR